MFWNQFSDFIDLDPDPNSSNFVDPDPDTINPDPHPWLVDSEKCKGHDSLKPEYAILVIL